MHVADDMVSFEVPPMETFGEPALLKALKREYFVLFCLGLLVTNNSPERLDGLTRTPSEGEQEQLSAHLLARR